MVYTFRYRTGFIHVSQPDRWSRPEVRWQLGDGDTRPARSVRAAKQAITRATKAR